MGRQLEWQRHKIEYCFFQRPSLFDSRGVLSTVKRMSVVQVVEGDGTKKFAEVVVKGAPDVIGHLLADRPKNYEKVRAARAPRFPTACPVSTPSLTHFLY